MSPRTVLIKGGAEEAYLLVPHETGVVYELKFGGLACRRLQIEGYLVPVDASVARSVLDDVFIGELERSGTVGQSVELPPDLLERVVAAVESILLWPPNGPPEALVVDRSRIEEIDEGWIPVLTSFGAAVLVWPGAH